jgi:hypothetical protein
MLHRQAPYTYSPAPQTPTETSLKITLVLGWNSGGGGDFAGLRPARFECQPEAKGEWAFELGVEGSGQMEVEEMRDERFGACSWFGGGFVGFV